LQALAETGLHFTIAAIADELLSDATMNGPKRHSSISEIVCLGLDLMLGSLMFTFTPVARNNPITSGCWRIAIDSSGTPPYDGRAAAKNGRSNAGSG
jgi:hypothetical protein